MCILCVTFFSVRLVLSSIYGTVLSGKNLSLINLLFQSRSESQSSSLSYSGVRPPWRSQTQCIISPGCSEGLQSGSSTPPRLAMYDCMYVCMTGRSVTLCNGFKMQVLYICSICLIWSFDIVKHRRTNIWTRRYIRIIY